jgi:acetyl-CoA C-acetyltransferase
MVAEAYIYDALRTPRGRGKKSGSLYEVVPVELLATLLRTLQRRHELDTSQIDDVIMGCVTPLGDQGADIARTAVLFANWDVDVPAGRNSSWPEASSPCPAFLWVLTAGR